MKTLKIGIAALALLTTITLGTAWVKRPQNLSAKQIPITQVPKAEIFCLAKNIYHEARGEPFEGQIAVAQVTLNRVASGTFNKTVCGVVYAHKQFSWTLDERRRVTDVKAWESAVDIAAAVLTGSVRLPEFKALYFHTKQVNPRWNRKKRVVAVIGNHIFYS